MMTSRFQVSSSSSPPFGSQTFTARGVAPWTARDLLIAESTEAIAAGIEWYDAARQAGERVTPGALVKAVREYVAPPPSMSCCPWTEELGAEWQTVLATVRGAADEDSWTMRLAPWLGRVHPHAHGEVWVLGASQRACRYLRHENGLLELLECAAGKPLEIVECDER